jgi:hypothetical protein
MALVAGYRKVLSKKFEFCLGMIEFGGYDILPPGSLVAFVTQWTKLVFMFVLVTFYAAVERDFFVLGVLSMCRIGRRI